MTDIVEVPALLATAREALLTGLESGAADDSRYVVRMVANAMAIAVRACAHGADARQRELATLRQLLADSTERADSLSTTPKRVIELRRRLCAEIRNGAFDAKERTIIVSLMEIVSENVAITNPRVLEALR